MGQVLVPVDEGVTTTAAGTAVAKTLVDVVVATESLSTLKELVIKAELVDTLSGEGPFTVFAPSNDAFKALPAATLNAVQSNDALLKKVLLLHVAIGAQVESFGLSDGLVIETGGISLYARRAGSNWKIENADGTSSANVILADVRAGNGVAHVIDAVILPTVNVTRTEPQKSSKEKKSGPIVAGVIIGVILVLIVAVVVIKRGGRGGRQTY